MTEYTDIPQVNVLYGECERTQQAVDNIDKGGTLTNFTIGSPPQPMGVQPTPPVGGMTTPSTPVTITLDTPASDQLITDLRAWLVARQANLEQQLADLGVTSPPALRK